MAVTSVTANASNDDNAQVEGKSKALRITDLLAKHSSQGVWSGDSQEYLQTIRKQLEDPSMSVKAAMTHLADNAVAFSTADRNSVVLVRENDVVNINELNADVKFLNAGEAFARKFPNNKLVSMVSCNRFMYQRPAQMANYITQTLLAQTDDQIAGFNIDSFDDRFLVHIDTEMSNVRQFFDAHSPNPTVAGSFGFIASVSDKQENRQGNFPRTTPMFGVTGYTEFNRNESTGQFTPIVHVTDILSVLASPKMLALALPLIAEVFINRQLWRQPFSIIGKDAGINIGNLIVDQATQKPFEVKNDVDYRKMFRDWITAPLLGIDIRPGHTGIPGIGKLTRPAEHDALIKDIYTFLNVQTTGLHEAIGRCVFKEIVGVFETSKSTKFSDLMDTRDVTYLYAVSKLKWSQKLDYLLTRNDIDPVRRFENIRDIIGEITPTHSNITTILYGNFISQIGAIVANKIKFVMPSSGDVPNIDFSSLMDKAYQPGTNMFNQAGPSSLIGSSWV